MQLNTRDERNNLPPPTSAPFFVAGGTLSRDAACYVTRKADEDLLNGLRQGQFCYVLTSRQMGKSSLMVRAATQLRQEGVAVAVLDLTAIGQNLTPEQWYDGLLNRVGRQLSLEDELDDFWEDNARVGPFQRFMRALFEVVLQKAPGRIVIFIDEIDAVRSLPFSTDEFFAGIRECYNARVEEPDLRRLTFALFGVASPSDLIRDTHTTPFNIGQRIELRDFTLEETTPLALGLAATEKEKEKRRKGEEETEEGKGEEIQGDTMTGNASALVNAHLLSGASPAASQQLTAPLNPQLSTLNRVLYWTNGHPYLTQRLCQALVEHATSTLRPLTVRDVDALCEELYLSSRARERDDNLLFVREWLLRSEVDTAGLLDLYAHIRSGKRIIDEESNRFVDVLRLSGVVRSEQGALLVRNRIYAHVFDRAWVLANMPDAELQRQRAAYRKGLLRALALSSVVLLMMGILTAVAVINARTAYAREVQATTAELNAKRAEAKERAATKKESKANVEAQTAKNRAEDASREAHKAAENERLAKVKAENASKQAHIAAQKERKSALEAQQQKQSAMASAKQAMDEKSKAQHNEHRANVSEALEREQKERVERLSYPDSIIHAQKALEQLNVTEAQDYLNRYAHPADPTRDLRGFEWRYLKHQGDGNSLRTFEEHSDSVDNFTISPDGAILASVSNDFIIHLRDLQTGKLLPAPVFKKGILPKVAFSPDKHTLAVITDVKLLLWDVPSERVRAMLPTLTPQGKPLAMSAFAYSPDGKLLALGSYSGSIDIWDTTTNKPVRHLLHHANGDQANNAYQIDAVGFSPDGKTLASCIWDHKGFENSTRLWDVATGRQLSTLGDFGQERLGGNRVYSLAFSPDGKWLATGGGQDHTARVWNMRDASHPTLMQKLTTHASDVTSVAFAMDGKWMATGSSDGIKLWDMSRAGAGGLREATTLRGHVKGITGVAFTPDSQNLVSSSQDKTLKLWNFASALPVVFHAHEGQVYTLAYSRDGTLLATANTYGDNTVRIWDAKTLTLKATTKPHPGGASAAFAPDGKTIAVAGGDRILTLCDTATGREEAQFEGFSEPFDTVAFSPDGKYIATGGQAYSHVIVNGFHPWNGYHARLWDVTTHKEIPEFAQHQGHNGWVLSLAFSPDSKILVSGGGGGELRWWDVAARKELGNAPHQSNGTTIAAEFVHQKNLFALAFSPDGKWLVTGSEDNTARLWDTRTRAPVATLLGHPNIVYAAAFSPDGKTLATGSRDGLIKLWSLANLRDKQVLDTISLAAHQEGIRSLDFSPDGNTLAAGNMDGSVRLWQADALPVPVRHKK